MTARTGMYGPPTHLHFAVIADGYVPVYATLLLSLDPVLHWVGCQRIMSPNHPSKSYLAVPTLPNHAFGAIGMRDGCCQRERGRPLIPSQRDEGAAVRVWQTLAQLPS